MKTLSPVIDPTTDSHQLIHQLGKVFVVAYKENTQQLEAFFAREGLECEVVRQVDKPEYEGFAAIYRCMLNHSTAWARVAQENKPCMIVEADSVPVMGLGKLPLPFNPQCPDTGISWLYTCAPQMYSVNREGHIEGYSTGLVSYIVTPQSANVLRGLVDEVTRKYGTGYVNFDSFIDQYLRDRGFKNYIPYRNYAEHGGRSNPEHRRNGMSGIHRADVLYGRLAFTPDYAKDENYFIARLHARVKGIARLLVGNFLRPKIVRHSSIPLRLVSTAIARQLTPRI